MLLYLYTRSYGVESFPCVSNNQAVCEVQTTAKEHKTVQETLPSSDAESSEKRSYCTEKGLNLTLDQAKHHLLVHVEVYACADRLGISELKDYALANFIDIASNTEMQVYHQAFFAEILDLVYETTVVERQEGVEKSPDKNVGCAHGLRHTATMCVVEHMKGRPNIPWIENSVREHEPLAWEVGRVLENEQSEHANIMSESSVRFEDLSNQLFCARADAIAKEATQRIIVGKLSDYLSQRSKKCLSMRCLEQLQVGSIILSGGAMGNRSLSVRCRSCNAENLLNGLV